MLYLLGNQTQCGDFLRTQYIIQSPGKQSILKYNLSVIFPYGFWVPKCWERKPDILVLFMLNSLQLYLVMICSETLEASCIL